MLYLMARLAQETSTGSLGSWLTITTLAWVSALSAAVVVSADVPVDSISCYLQLDPSSSLLIAIQSF